MKKNVTIIGAIIVASVLFSSCGKKSSDYDNLIKEYKQVLCVGLGKNSNSLSDKTQALTRQLELNQEYAEALKNLSDEEKAKLMMKWAKALAEVADGKCD